MIIGLGNFELIVVPSLFLVLDVIGYIFSITLNKLKYYLFSNKTHSDIIMGDRVN